MSTLYASVILDVAINKTLDYAVPSDLINTIQIGMQVAVPLRGGLRNGYILELNPETTVKNPRPLAKVLNEQESVPKELLELALWMARYYCAPLEKVMKVILPPSIRKATKAKEQLFIMRAKPLEELRDYCKEIRNRSSPQATVLDAMLKVKKGILLSELLEETQGSRSPVDTLIKKGYLVKDVVRIDRSPLTGEEYFKTKAKILTGEQKIALDKVLKDIESDTFATHLLHGVTGSGKTEVYLQAIDTALKQGKGAIMLVPEIALTSQTIERFRSRFEEKIAVLHSRLSHGERFDAWQKIRNGKAPIVIGARSAIFSPVKNLGIIVVDEEHEQSYKQSEEAPRYHARDVAVMRANLSHCPVILGTATPSLESYHNALTGKYILSTLSARADTSELPTVKVVDMRREYEKAKGYTTFSEELLNGIEKRLKNGEQSILFLNRRGYHSSLICPKCSEVTKCHHCDVALTYHKQGNALVCHLCGYRRSPPPEKCPKCRGGAPMKFRGVGTEQVERALHAIFPDVRTIRLDADTTRHKGSHQKLLREFGTGKADVLIGTQMIAKGLHFPEVTLVGVLNSDASLNIPDFRSSETVFQLITQVAGRAGRGALAGEVVIQTTMPDNSTILLASKQDYEGFYNEEIAIRELFRYPPFAKFAKCVFSGKDKRATYSVAQHWQQQLIQKLPAGFEVAPVVPSGYTRVKDQFRFQFLIRGNQIYTLNQVLNTFTHPRFVRVAIDIHPSSTYF